MANYSLQQTFVQLGKNILNWVKSNCVNNLVSDATNLPLAAAQGKKLQGEIDTLNSNLDTITLSKKTFSDGADANTLRTGIYIVLNNVKNTPATHGTLVTLDTGFFSQLFLGTDGKFYTRQKVNEVWTGWISR